MTRWTSAFALAVALSCGVEEVDLTGKRCPCAPGWTCDVAADRCVQGNLPATGGAAGSGSGGAAGGGSGGAAGTGGIAGGISICDLAEENTPLSLVCPSGTVIASVDFASYGDTTGTCTAPSLGPCHATTSKAVTQCHCLGKASCSFDASNAQFGDPCVTVGKRLLVSATCADAFDASAGGSGGTCSASGGTGGTTATGGTGGTTATGGSGGTSQTGGTGGSGGTTGDSVLCGSETCSTSGSLCCIGTSTACQSNSVPCAGAKIKCDGPEDCAGNEVCCATLIGGKIDQLSCLGSIKCNPDAVVCGSSASSCTSGLSCKPSPELPAYKLCLP